MRERGSSGDRLSHTHHSQDSPKTNINDIVTFARRTIQQWTAIATETRTTSTGLQEKRNEKAVYSLCVRTSKPRSTDRSPPECEAHPVGHRLEHGYQHSLRRHGGFKTLRLPETVGRKYPRNAAYIPKNYSLGRTIENHCSLGWFG